MPSYSFYVYAPDVLVFDPDTGNFDFSASYDWTTDRNRVDYSDDDSVFDGDSDWDGSGDDANQVGSAFDDTGALIEAGEVYVQQYAEIQAPDGTTFDIDRIEIDGVHVGYLPSGALTPGTSYAVIFSENMGNAVSDGSGGTYNNTLAHSYYTSNSVPCFDAATVMSTPEGLRQVGAIKVGDLVDTLDDGPQPVRWRSLRRVNLSARRPQDLPVLLKAGCLGQGRPARDLIVSAQHRILIGHDSCAYGEQGKGLSDCEVLVPAKALVGVVAGVRLMQGRKQANWVHLALPRHGIVSANGLWTESLLLGEVTLRGLAPFARLHLQSLGRMGLLQTLPLSARPCLGASAARRAMRRALARKASSQKEVAISGL